MPDNTALIAELRTKKGLRPIDEPARYIEGLLDRAALALEAASSRGCEETVTEEPLARVTNEWAVIASGGVIWWGVTTSGPQGARYALAAGDITYASDPWSGDTLYQDGEPVVESVRRAPEGSYVAVRTIEKSQWYALAERSKP